ncbi:hypothetical protein MKO06_10955 [Gramella sp. GC03-9]|uniref:DUF4412 domain-containing protein n=1 Tax=Christiangramia oceanisediminis TaxID=2920386 RepID=A0A9X2KY27_9FLAO|nr:hypothetical protein [Gramella oceanisediminis]MCP9200432.1 hypothetical protein [Gramella oceanisediminis]
MKGRLLIVSLCFLFTSSFAEGQIFKKLKKEVEKTVESAFDSIVNPQKQNNTSEVSSENYKSSNKAKTINSAAKRAFYTSDVIVKTSDSEGPGSTYYFDSNEIAARGEAPNAKGPIYIDSEGFNYAYNEGEGRWEKTGLMRSDGMAFMMPTMSMGILKLPAEPSLEASRKLKEQGLNMNTFQIVELAFIYKPEHFRNGDYEETSIPCTNGGSCPKFLNTNPENRGSWVLFDSEGRLSEIFAKVDSQQAKGTGSFKFLYQPVSVKVPDAVEVKMPFQDLFLAGADATPPGENNPASGNNIEISSGNTSSEKVTQSSMRSTGEKGNLGKDNLPGSYDFDWEYHLKMHMSNQKQDAMDMILLLRKGANYQGIKMKVEKSVEATMVFDLNINSLVMLIQSGDGKFLQVHTMQNQDNPGNLPEFKIRELPDKTIIGYNSKGVEIENEDYFAQVYHTTQAPIKTNGLFNFSGPMDKELPNIDPDLIKQFSESLITEINYTDKKKPRNNILLTAQSLNQVKTSINTGEYQNMSFMDQRKKN